MHTIYYLIFYFLSINYLNYPYKLFHGQWYFPHWFVLICNPIAICLRTKPYQNIYMKKKHKRKSFPSFSGKYLCFADLCNCKMFMLVLVFSDFVLYYINMNLILLLLSYISEPTEWKSNNKNKKKHSKHDDCIGMLHGGVHFCAGFTLFYTFACFILL